MGGDAAPEAIVAGAVLAGRDGIPVVLVGDEARIAPLLPRGSTIAVHHAADAVAMDDAPHVVRRRPDASVRSALRLVGERQACAAVTAGNTGAAMAAALLELGRIPGVDRPSLTMVLPRSDGGELVVLDLGANVDCRAEHLEGFARMGVAFAEAEGMTRPRVGLLSNGEEEGKGNEQVRDALPRLAALPFDFVGPIEPTAAMRGGCDVLVCDGFVGNVMLKTVEATAEVVALVLREELLRYPSARVGVRLLAGAFRRFRRRIDYTSAGGALLLGVDGVVVVGHGRSDAAAVRSAARYALHCAAEDVVGGIARSLVVAGGEPAEPSPETA